MNRLPINKNKDGLMEIWMPVDKNDLSKGGQYNRVQPVDARELMERSGALMKSPEDKEAAPKTDAEINDSTEQDVMKTSKKDLIKLIKEENLTVDVDAFEKLADIRQAVQAALIEKAKQG